MVKLNIRQGRNNFDTRLLLFKAHETSAAAHTHTYKNSGWIKFGIHKEKSIPNTDKYPYSGQNPNSIIKLLNSI